MPRVKKSVSTYRNTLIAPDVALKSINRATHLQLLQDVDTIGTLRRMRTKWRRQDSTYNCVSNVADLLLLVRLFRTVAYSCLCVGIFYFSSIKF